MELFGSDDWDYVVFNNYSFSVIDILESFMMYGVKFVDKVKVMGVKFVFMMIWGYKLNLFMQDCIIEMYICLVQESGVEVVFCGFIFVSVCQWWLDLELFFDDKYFLVNGMYLLSLVFYKFFLEQCVVGIFMCLIIFDVNGEKLYLVFMYWEDVDFFQ